MSDGKKILSNIFYYFLDFTTLTVFGYIFWILMGKMLEPMQYGILFTTLSIFQIVSIFLTLGFYESLPKFISEFKIKRETEKIKSIIFFSTNIVFYFSLIFSIFVLLFSENLSHIFYGSSLMSDVFKFLSVLLFGGSIALVLKSIAQGLQNFKIIFLADLIGCSVKIGVALFLVMLGFQALSGVFAYMAWYLIIILTLFFVISGLKTRQISIDKKKVLKFSVYSFLASFGSLFLTQGTVFLLSILYDFEAAGLFGVAFLFGQLILFVPNVLLGSLFPNLSEMWEVKREKVRELVSMSIKLITVSALPTLAAFVVFSKTLISLFYSELYIEASTLFPSFLLASFLYGISNILLITLYSAHMPKRRLLIILSAAATNILFSLLLIPSLGALGASLSYLISSVIVFVLSLLSINKILKLSFSRKSLYFFPIFLLFTIVLIYAETLESMLLQSFLTFLDFVLLSLVSIKLGIVNKNDLKFLDYVPDKLGLDKIKKLIRRLM